MKKCIVLIAVFRLVWSYHCNAQNINAWQAKETGGDSIVCFALSPNGTQLATGSYHGQIKIWQLDNLESPLLFKKLAGSIGSIQFSPDGKRLGALILSKPPSQWSVFEKICTVCANGDSLLVWDIKTGIQKLRFTNGSSRDVSTITSFSFEPGGEATVSVDGSIYWVTDHGSYQSRSVIHHGVKYLTYSRDGNTLLALSTNFGLAMLEAKEGHFTQEIKTERTQGNDVIWINTSASGKYFVLGYRNGNLVTYNVNTGEKFARFSVFSKSEKRNYAMFRSIEFSPMINILCAHLVTAPFVYLICPAVKNFMFINQLREW